MATTPLRAQRNRSTRRRCPTTRPTDNRPCSNVCKTCVNDRAAIHSSRPGRPATVKSSTQEPIVKARVTIAAVAALSDTDAENSAMAPTNKPYRRCPKNKFQCFRRGQVSTTHAPDDEHRKCGDVRQASMQRARQQLGSRPMWRNGKAAAPEGVAPRIPFPDRAL